MSSSTLNSWAGEAEKPQPPRSAPGGPSPAPRPRPRPSRAPPHLGSDHAPLELAERLAVVGLPGRPQTHGPLLWGTLPTLLHLQLGERVQGVLRESEGSGGPPWTRTPQTHPPVLRSHVIRRLSFPQETADQERHLGVSVSSKARGSLGLSGDSYNVFCGPAQDSPRHLTSCPGF